MVLGVGDTAVTYYRQSLYNANHPARPPATMTGHRQPEFAIGKVLVRLKVTRLMWECNRASFVGPRNSPTFCGKTAILRQSPKQVTPPISLVFGRRECHPRFAEPSQLARR